MIAELLLFYNLGFVLMILQFFLLLNYCHIVGFAPFALNTGFAICISDSYPNQ